MSPKSKRVKASKSKCKKTVSKRGGGFFGWSSSSNKPADGTTPPSNAPTPENKSSITDRWYSYFSNMSSTSPEKSPVVKEEQGAGVNGQEAVVNGQGAVVNGNTKMGGKKRSNKSHTSRKHRKTNKNAAK